MQRDTFLRWLSIPIENRGLVMRCLTPSEQQRILNQVDMRPSGGITPEDQHTFVFPGIGKLIVSQEWEDFLRIDFVPDSNPVCPETANWPSDPSLIATIGLHHMTIGERLSDQRTGFQRTYEVGPTVVVESGDNGDPHAIYFIPRPGEVVSESI